MDELFGPVIGITLVLMSVFIGRFRAGAHNQISPT